MRLRFEKLEKMSNDQMLKIVDFRGMFQLPAVMYLGFVLHHTVHHRGTIVDVSAADGGEGAFDLRRELGCCRGSQGCAERLEGGIAKHQGREVQGRKRGRSALSL